ncbi:hypothetical protein QEJ31_05995 [Pigmentibacter sp. JX0631]|uniref:hypothetical protein n=1 Tax=Pigmentibacter sp. JX0631 TaxID=2976982 RepID=UPI002468443B|nr:hypothetical protein [Pigmentibacter sp. JX0631]WGL61146.1 hypothetical protein QEJ31_05995 [Pigmentibacter sp. JX0631]
MENVSRHKKIIGIISILIAILICAIIFYFKFFSSSFDSIKMNETKVLLKYQYLDESINKKLSVLNLDKNLPDNVYNECNADAYTLDKLLHGVSLNSIDLPKRPDSKAVCDNFEKIILARTNPTLVIKIANGKDFYNWYTKNEKFQKIKESEVFSGYMSNYSDIKNITSLEIGFKKVAEPFLNILLKEIIEANPIIYYDTIRGKNGIVLEYNTEDTRSSKNILVTITKKYGKKKYAFKGSNVKIWEINLANQDIYISEVENKIYLSFNLITLINTLENPREEFSIKDPNASVVAKLRLESYFDNFLNVLFEKNKYNPEFSFKLTENETKPLNMKLERNKLFDILTPSFSDGVLKSIPHDVFFSFAASISIPNPIPVDDLIIDEKLNYDVFKLGKNKSGFAFIWDLNSDAKFNISEVGLIISNNKTNLDEGFPIDGLVAAENGIVEYCKQANVYIMASSSQLFNKMSSSCKSQNKSILNWKSGDLNNFTSSQLFFSFNLNTFFSSSFLSATKNLLSDDNENSGKEQIPDWKRKSIQEINNMKNDTLKTLNQLPIFGFYGKNNENLTGFSLNSKEF